MLKLLNKLFNLLPFNGQKTVISGIILLVLQILRAVFPDLPYDNIVDLLNQLFLLLFELGIIHKAIKIELNK